MSTTFTEFVTLERCTCGKCGGVFALNQDVLTYARANAGHYHCPYCETEWGWSKSEAQKLREQLEQTQRELREANCRAINERAARESVESENIKLGRKLVRVRKGVCPCCTRSFSNLKRHMETKHPEVSKA